MAGLHELKPAPGSSRNRRRVGRGDGSGRGTYSGRGSKGQGQHGKVPPLFEGGQLPLVKRLPYMRGFHNRFRTEYAGVNVGRLAVFDPDAEVTPEKLLERRLVRRSRDLVKILGGGDVSAPLNVSAHAFSKSAREKIEAAGGTATVLPGPGSEKDQ